MAELAAVLLLAGAGVTAAGQIQGGRLAEAEGKAAQDMAEFNARQLEREAKSTQEAAKFDERRIAKKEKITIGRQIARAGKSGVTLEGSPIGELADIASSFATDRALTLRRGLLGAQALTTQAGVQRAQGKLAKIRGRQAKRVSLLKAGGTIALAVGTSGLLAGGGGGGGDITRPGSFPTGANF